MQPKTIQSVRKRNKSNNPKTDFLPIGLKLLFNKTAEDEHELAEIDDNEDKILSSSSDSEDEKKVFKLKERLRLKKKAERE